MHDVSATFATQQARLEGSYPIDMYVVNASLSGYDPLYYVNANQDVYGWTITSGGVTTTTPQLYTGLPIERGQLDTNIAGEISEVSLSIPNTNRVMESIIQNYDYLRGREIYFISTFAKHLPSGNTAEHVGNQADKNALIKEKFYIDSVNSNESAVTFSCKSKFNIRNIILPRRTFSRECTWALAGKYGESECGVSAGILSSYPTCDGTLNNCRTRENVARYGGFPGIPRRGFVII